MKERNIMVCMPMSSKSYKEVMSEYNDVVSKLTPVFERHDIKPNFMINAQPTDDDTAERLGADAHFTFMERGFSLIKKADTLIFVPDWKNKSRGCRIEKLVASEYGKECIDLYSPTVHEFDYLLALLNMKKETLHAYIHNDILSEKSFVMPLDVSEQDKLEIGCIKLICIDTHSTMSRTLLELSTNNLYDDIKSGNTIIKELVEKE